MAPVHILSCCLCECVCACVCVCYSALLLTQKERSSAKKNQKTKWKQERMLSLFIFICFLQRYWSCAGEFCYCCLVFRYSICSFHVSRFVAGARVPVLRTGFLNKREDASWSLQNCLFVSAHTVLIVLFRNSPPLHPGNRGGRGGGMCLYFLAREKRCL